MSASGDVKGIFDIMTAANPSVPVSSGLTRILTAGLAGGAVDFIYACVVGATKGRSVMQVWQGVASGWLGKAAGAGGWGSSALGMVTHFGIATVMAATYALAATRLPVLYRRPLLCGFLYGFVLYAVMYGIVLPTRFGRAYHWDGLLSATDIASHVGTAMVMVWVLARSRRT
jgi:hypothetical protein